MKFLGVFTQGRSIDIEIESSGAGYIDAWLDLDGDGTWNQQSDRILDGLVVTEGVNTVVVNIPADAAVGSAYTGGFRLSSEDFDADRSGV